MDASLHAASLHDLLVDASSAVGFTLRAAGISCGRGMRARSQRQTRVPSSRTAGSRDVLAACSKHSGAIGKLGRGTRRSARKSVRVQ